MTEEKIKAISFKVDEVGKYMKGSKKRFEWVLGLNNKTHTIILDFSFISGKVKAYVDGRVLLENQIPLNTSFQHPFTLDGFALNLIQQGQNCQLRVNNKVFSHLYTQEKTNQQFKKDDSEFGIQMNKDFMNKIGSTNQGAQKITLDIGQGKKNFTKKKADDGDWGVFGGIGFPSGFEPPPGTTSATSTTFGSQFDAPTKQNAQTIDFFGDETAPSKPVTSASGDLLSGDAPQQTATQPTQPTQTQPSIESLYQQPNMMNTNALNMMNTNQLLFNTALHQQQAMGPVNTTMINTSALNTTGTSNSPPQGTLPFNTMANLFATSSTVPTGVNMGMVPNMGMNTSVNIMGTNPTATLPTNAFPTMSNPNYQINTGFQTGGLNLNQLYQTNQMLGTAQIMQPTQQAQPNIADLTSLTGMTHTGQMFPTTVPAASQVANVGFNTTVPTGNKDIFDLM